MPGAVGVNRRTVSLGIFGMRLGTRGRYAVTALADIALKGAKGPVALAAVAQRQNLSGSYLEQLFVSLRRADLVLGVRGPGGGYRLCRPACTISIAEIFAAVDESVLAILCEGEVGERCAGSRERCLTHDLWEQLAGIVHVYLQRTTLADVIEHRLTPCPAVPDFVPLVAGFAPPVGQFLESGNQVE